jgi:O-succinylbenzoic acid--CoA ligase
LGRFLARNFVSGLAVFHADYAEHLRETLAALDAGIPTFLGNPQWGEAEMREASRQIPAGVRVAGKGPIPVGMGPCDWHLGWAGRIMIPSGGTGGRVKFIIHEANTLRAAALSLRDALVQRGFKPTLHGVIVTPPWHVSGLMPAMRARETSGTFAVLNGRFTPDEPLPNVTLPTTGTRILSLVPTQLTRLLGVAPGADWLRQFDIILLGGSSLPSPLRELIGRLRLPVYVTYGMTETAAACALCPPELVWSKHELRGAPLPDVSFQTANGRLQVSTPALGRGVWPNLPLGQPYLTSDYGDVAPDGTIKVHGRADQIILTGGEKVDSTRVEQALIASGIVSEVKVFGQPDVTWGEAVTACVVGNPALEASLRLVADTLEPAARPKQYVFVASLPTDERGKFDRSAALAKLKA